MMYFKLREYNNLIRSMQWYTFEVNNLEEDPHATL
jgi:hypothetical protein